MARKCYWIDPTQVPDEGGYVPSLVVEGEAGHSPMRGDASTFQAPWYWGKTLAEANATAERTNLEDFGLDKDEVFEIIFSSMRASSSSVFNG